MQKQSEAPSKDDWRLATRRLSRCDFLFAAQRAPASLHTHRSKRRLLSSESSSTEKRRKNYTCRSYIAERDELLLPRRWERKRTLITLIEKDVSLRSQLITAPLTFSSIVGAACGLPQRDGWGQPAPLEPTVGVQLRFARARFFFARQHAGPA